METTVATPATPAAPAAARIPTWLKVVLLATALAALWLVALDNGQASGMVDSTGTLLHELFHDARHLSGAPCH
jgi:Probable cobalt transporter subunit (CbtB)